MPNGVHLGLLLMSYFLKNQIEKIVPKPMLDPWTPRTFPTGHSPLKTYTASIRKCICWLYQLIIRPTIVGLLLVFQLLHGAISMRKCILLPAPDHLCDCCIGSLGHIPPHPATAPIT